MSETPKCPPEAGCEVCDILRVAPHPSVPSGEAVAWVMTFHGKMLMDSFFLDEAEAKANKGMRDRKYGDAEFRGLIPLYAAPPQERVSENAVRVAVEGALCYDCGCESEGPWKCERVIAALSAGRADD